MFVGIKNAIMFSLRVLTLIHQVIKSGNITKPTSIDLKADKVGISAAMMNPASTSTKANHFKTVRALSSFKGCLKSRNQKDVSNQSESFPVPCSDHGPNIYYHRQP